MQTLNQNILFDQIERIQFATNMLWQTWADQYPFLFDDEDRMGVSKQPVFHYYQWLAAIRLYENFGYLSLVEKYQSKKQVRKNSILRQITSKEIAELLSNAWIVHRCQCPDLLVYVPDKSEYFFCNVSGQYQRITEKQDQFFLFLSKISDRPVRDIRFIPQKLIYTTEEIMAKPLSAGVLARRTL